MSEIELMLPVQEIHPGVTTSVVTAEDNYKAHKERLKATIKELQNAGKEYFKEKVNSIFAKYPTFMSFSWTQYTPTWCDGDTCEFGVNHDLVEVNGLGYVGSANEDDDYDDYDDPEEPEYKHYVNGPKGSRGRYEPLDDDVSRGAFEAEQLLRSFDKSDLEQMFGDDALIRVTREGVEVQEFEHDEG